MKKRQSKIRYGFVVILLFVPSHILVMTFPFQKRWLVMFTNLPGVNIPIMTDFKLAP
jgi:uncharacterized membrane protein